MLKMCLSRNLRPDDQWGSEDLVRRASRLFGAGRPSGIADSETQRPLVPRPMSAWRWRLREVTKRAPHIARSSASRRCCWISSARRTPASSCAACAVDAYFRMRVPGWPACRPAAWTRASRWCLHDAPWKGAACSFPATIVRESGPGGDFERFVHPSLPNTEAQGRGR